MSLMRADLEEELLGGAENLLLFEVVDSTHDVALRMVEQMDAEGMQLWPTVVMARQQRAGRGRGERSWMSPRGGLYLSWVSSGLDAERLAELPLLAAAAAHAAVAPWADDGVRLKWPNDLMLDGAKLGGVLVHARHGDPVWVTVGLGLNVHGAPGLAAGADYQATCLADHHPEPLERDVVDRLAVGFVRNFAGALDDPGPAIERWRESLLHRPGDRLTVRLASGQRLTGRFDGLTEEGFLRLGVEDGERVVSSGDVVEGLATV